MRNAGLGCLILILAFSTLGCSAREDGEVTIIDDKSIPVVVENDQLIEFNTQLGEVEDQASAEKAVNTFVDYVDSSLKKEDGVSAQSLRSLISSDLVKSIAEKEVLARNGEGVTVLSTDDPTAEVIAQLENLPIDSGSVTDTINDLGEDVGYRIQDEDVEMAKTVVEGAIPNLNPEGEYGMTPLGAMAVGYALTSGDDGTAKENSVEVPVDKFSAFAEEMAN